MLILSCDGLEFGLESPETSTHDFLAGRLESALSLNFCLIKIKGCCHGDGSDTVDLVSVLRDMLTRAKAFHDFAIIALTKSRGLLWACRLRLHGGL